MKLLSSTRIATAVIALFLAAAMFACKKENNSSADAVTEQEATVYSSESLEADASFDDIQDVAMTTADEEAIESAGKPGDVTGHVYLFLHLRARLGNSAVITVSPEDKTYPKTVTIDFGNGAICADGKFRKGKMVLHFTAPVRQSGSVITITLVDFQLNRAQIEGTKTITNLSANGDIKFTVRVTNGKVTFPSGRGYTFVRNKTVTQIEGGATAELNDDVYSIKGHSETTFNNGVVVKLDTDDALIKKISCPWITDGTMNVKINSRNFAIDFGFPNNGDCDQKALLSWNNKQEVILLP